MELQIVENENEEIFILVELWGMYQNFILVRADDDVIKKWHELEVDKQGEFFNQLEKWELRLNEFG